VAFIRRFSPMTADPAPLPTCNTQSSLRAALD
jgi:hypothetical protein